MHSYYPSFLKIDTTKNRKAFYALSGVMLLFWLIRWLNGDYRLADSNEYIQTALLIKNGSWFLPTSSPERAMMLTKRPFLYPLWLLFTGPANDGLIAFLQNIFGLLTLFLAVKLFEMKGGRKPSVLFLFILLTPCIFIYTHLLMTEVIAACLITLLAVLCFSEFNRGKFIGIQLIIGLLPFLKPVFYPFVFINFFYWLFLYFKKKQSIMLLSALPILFVFLYMGFNSYRTGYFQFSSIQTINLENYNLFYFEVKENGYDRALQVKDSLDQEALKYSSFKDRSRFLEKASADILSRNLFSYALFHTEGAIRGIFDPGRFDLFTLLPKSDKRETGFLKMLNEDGLLKTLKKIFHSPELWIYLILIPVFLALIVKWILIGKYAWGNHNNPDSRVLFFCLFVGFIILITGPLNASRFMMPFEPVLSVFASLAITGPENRTQV